MSSGSAAAAASPIQVMVVDDSAVIRGLLTRTLEADSDIEVVASVGNGQSALGSLARTPVDVVVLDIEMPVMDGLTALPKLIAAQPGLQVIMASTLTRKNAEISLKALAAGAADYIPKPTSTSEINRATDFRRELVEKVKALGAAARAARGAGKPGPKTKPLIKAVPTRLYSGRPIRLRAAPVTAPGVLAIGSSTGGPQALFAVLANIASAVNLPVLVTQHMPATFTAILAEHIGQATGLPAAEARDGEPVLAGRIYVAPGDFHLTVGLDGQQKVIHLTKTPPENFCRPAVDPMLRSLAKAYGGQALVTILTGMGQDGMRGAEAVVAAGGSVIAQDEATSVVWGMPGAVATAGLCSAILPLPDIASYIRKLLLRSAA